MKKMVELTLSLFIKNSDQIEGRMLRIVVGILCATALVMAAPINDIGALKVVGNQIQGANGQPAQLMGMNFYHEYYDSPRKGGRDFVNRSVVESLAKNWRSSVVRFTMMYKSESGAGGEKGYDQDPTNAVKMVDSIVKVAIDYGIYVVVDWPHVPTMGYQDQA
jgi:aryl-phospho-beta-D-glucosidase BglC (GH1 family)